MKQLIRKSGIIFFFLMAVCALTAILPSGLNPSIVAEAAKKPKLNKKKVKITKIPSDMILDYKDYSKMNVNKYTLSVKNKIKNSTYKWKSSRNSIATVSGKKTTGTAVVKAKKSGTAVITCTITKPNKKKIKLTCKVTVKFPASKITIYSDDAEITEELYCSMTVGDKNQFYANVVSASTSDTVFWDIEDKEIATVDEDGLVTAIAEGRTVLRAEAAEDWDVADSKKTTYAIVLDIQPVMASVTEVSLTTYNEVQITFSEPVVDTTVLNNSIPVNVKIVATNKSRAPGTLTGTLSADKRILIISSSNGLNGTYNIEISGVQAQSGLRVAPYKKEEFSVKDSSASSDAASIVSVSRTSASTIEVTFDKTMSNPGTLMIKNTSITAIYGERSMSGIINSINKAKVVYTIDGYFQSLTGEQNAVLTGYKAESDKTSQVYNKNLFINFTVGTITDGTKQTDSSSNNSNNNSNNSSNTPVDTSNEQLPKPSNVVQSTTDNNTIYVMFQNRVDVTSAEIMSNYYFSGGPVIESVVVEENKDTGALIALNVRDGSITRNGEYTLTVMNVKGYNNMYLPMQSATYTVILKDNQMPTFNGAHYDASSKKIILNFSEDIIGTASFSVTDDDGKTISHTPSVLSTTRVTLQLDEAVKSGTILTVMPAYDNDLVDMGGNKVSIAAFVIAIP